MLKIFVILYCFYLTILSALGAHTNNTAKTATPKPDVSFLDKFHQNDYKLTYEYGKTIRTDKRFGDFRQDVFKYNRTTTAMNFTLLANADMGFEIEVIVQVYKFLSNEYRLFPIRFEVNLCKAMTKQLVGSNKLSECVNFSCPISKGSRYVVHNWTPEESNLPPLIPTGKYMAELQFMYRSHEVLVTRGYISVYRPITVIEN